jgi:hypothetical protein
MAWHIKLATHLSADELAQRARRASDPEAGLRWQILWLLAKGQTATQVAAVTGYSAYWVGQLARRYNAAGEPDRSCGRSHGRFLKRSVNPSRSHAPRCAHAYRARTCRDSPISGRAHECPHAQRCDQHERAPVRPACRAQRPACAPADAWTAGGALCCGRRTVYDSCITTRV